VGQRRQLATSGIDSSSEASSDGKAKGHPDHRAQSGRSPRRVVTSNTTLQYKSLQVHVYVYTSHKRGRL
jgi:hypothetical protein